VASAVVDDVPVSERLLAYVYHPRSFATLSLSEAARGLCTLLWIVDSSNDEQASMQRLLRRLGTVVDIKDLGMEDAAAAIARFEPDGILTLADDNLRLCSELASRLGQRFYSPETTLRLTDKHLQREALERAGLAVPRSWVISPTDYQTTWLNIESQIRYPAVLKPRRGEASRDTVLVNSSPELGALIEEHLAHGEREFVIEEFIPDALPGAAGEGFAGYVSVESFMVDGTVVHLAINGRLPQAFPFRETGFFIPSALDDEVARTVLDVAAAAIRAMEVTIGCFHTEIKLTPDGPVVIEVNGRIGGGVPEMLVAATGVDFLKIAMSLALGDEVETDDLPPADRVAYLFYVHAPTEMRRILAVDGLDELRAMDGVDEVVLNRGPGQTVDWREGNHGHVFSVFGTAADHDGVRLIDQANRSVVTIVGE
jgi:biotin carboxylase